MTDIYDIFCTIILYLISYLNISFLLGNKKKPNLVIFLLGMFLFSLSTFFSSPLRILLQLLILVVIGSFSFKNIKKNIEAAIFQFWVLLTIEIVISLLLFILKIELSDSLLILYNFMILILSYFLLKERHIFKFWTMIQKSSSISLILPFFIIIYINIGIQSNIIIGSILYFLLMFYVYLLLKEKMETYFFLQHIEHLTNFIVTYEKEIDNQRQRSHEFHNSLLYIRSLASKNKEVTDYIDSILGYTSPINYELLKDIQKLKISPLKGYIYYKLMECDQYKINSTLNISSNLPYQKIKTIESNLIQQLSKIFGILIDNAMEACLETETKSLSIYIYEEKDELIFQISNTFKGSIHINFIYKKGYSTKGKGRGYGLHFVQSILNENPKLFLKSEIHDDVFIQYLKLKLN